MSLPIIEGIDESQLSIEQRNALAILRNLLMEKVNYLKNVMNLGVPGVIGSTTLDKFLQLCKKYGFDLSEAGVNAFKDKHQLDNTGSNQGVIGPVTASFYYDELLHQPRWMEIAEREIGQKEKPGPDQDNPRIVEYHRASENLLHPLYTHDHIAWCSSFVNWCMREVGIQGTKHALAFSWRNWGIPLSQPKFGCVVVLKGYKGQGHVGFFHHSKGNDRFILGGNQNDAVNIKAFPKSEIIEYRWLN